MDKIKVAAIGSCVTRDNFNSKFISDYKDHYEIIYYQHQISIVSLMAEPIPYLQTDINNIKTHEQRHLETELSKSFFNTMILNQPDYLVLDLYGDVFHGVQKVENSYLTYRPYLFSKTDVYNKLDKADVISLYKNSKRFLEIWKKAVNELFRYMKEYVPNCKIVLNKARLATQYKDEKSGEIKFIFDNKKVRKLDVDLHNFWWRRLDRYIENNFDVQVIDYEDHDYLANENHSWKLSYGHFVDDFYKDFTKKFRTIIAENKLEYQAVLPVEKQENNNLVINSNFKEGNNFWYHWKNDFAILKDGTLYLKKEGLQKDINRQVWSNTIEAHATGDKIFTLSFDVKIKDINEVDSYGTIFSIRMFDKAFELSKSEAVWYKPIMIKDLNYLVNDEWCNIVVSFAPPKGKFMKVAPFLHRNGEISWRNIKVELGHYKTPWSPSFNGL